MIVKEARLVPKNSKDTWYLKGYSFPIQFTGSIKLRPYAKVNDDKRIREVLNPYGICALIWHDNFGFQYIEVKEE